MVGSAKVLPLSAVAAALVLVAASGRAQATRADSGRASVTAGAAREPVPLGDSVRAAVEEALRDEIRGEAIYARVLKDHGDARPFSNVVRAERRHAAFLEDLLKARGLAVPAHTAEAEAPGYASVKEACAAAIAFEAQNVALYDRLLAAGPVPEDVRRAFDHNRVASLDHHKPAFERCAGVATARGAGRGAGHGAGQGTGRGGGCGEGCGHCGHRHGRHGGGWS